jgi:hypothetical protein
MRAKLRQTSCPQALSVTMLTVVRPPERIAICSVICHAPVRNIVILDVMALVCELAASPVSLSSLNERSCLTSDLQQLLQLLFIATLRRLIVSNDNSKSKYFQRRTIEWPCLSIFPELLMRRVAEQSVEQSIPAGHLVNHDRYCKKCVTGSGAAPGLSDCHQYYKHY